MQQLQTGKFQRIIVIHPANTHVLATPCISKKRRKKNKKRKKEEDDGSVQISYNFWQGWWILFGGCRCRPRVLKNNWQFMVGIHYHICWEIWSSNYNVWETEVFYGDSYRGEKSSWPTDTPWVFTENRLALPELTPCDRQDLKIRLLTTHSTIAY